MVYDAEWDSTHYMSPIPPILKWVGRTQSTDIQGGDEENEKDCIEARVSRSWFLHGDLGKWAADEETWNIPQDHLRSMISAKTLENPIVVLDEEQQRLSKNSQNRRVWPLKDWTCQLHLSRHQ